MTDQQFRKILVDLEAIKILAADRGHFLILIMLFLLCTGACPPGK